MQEYLTYDDVSIIPKISDIESRTYIDTSSKLTKNYTLTLPVVSSPMDTVTEYEMAKAMRAGGGVGTIHRFMTIEEGVRQFRKAESYHQETFRIQDVVMSIGVAGDWWERFEILAMNGCKMFLIDVAHGHTTMVRNALEKMKSSDWECEIIAGNIATAEAAEDLIRWGADGLRVGIGGGCFTPNMKVQTSDGLVCIKNIKIGDFVKTHTGKSRKVLRKFIFFKNEEITVINGIESTNNHEYYVIKKSDRHLLNENNVEEYATWIKASELTKDYLLIEVQ